MSRVRLYLDLDRTLFRTTECNQGIWRLLGDWYAAVDGEYEFNRQRDFYQYADDMYWYDFTAHVKYLGLSIPEVYQRLRQSELADGRLEYTGVRELVDWAQQATDLSILTYGPDDYQRLKASLCPSLVRVDIITTAHPKQYYFEVHSPQGETWLVDDKPIGGELPDGVQFIQVVGYNGIVAPKGCDWATADSLAKVRQILQG